MSAPGLPPGIRRRHARSCPAVATDDLAACSCRPSYQAQAGPRRGRRTKTHNTLGEARAWKREVERLFVLGELGVGGRVRLRDAGESWLTAAAGGMAMTRSGTAYRPATLAGYRLALREHVYPALGDRRLEAVTRGEVLALIGKLQAAGLSPSSVRNVIVPLRALYRYAGDHDWTQRNPTRGVAMPGVSSARRERFATPVEVRALLDALPERDRALWATAAYAGLRRGELMGLRWADVDLDSGELWVCQVFDHVGKCFGPPKTAAGVRNVPIAGPLRRLLIEHERRRCGELVFARGSLAGGYRGRATAPFADRGVAMRAHAAWDRADLEPLGLHECRHTFASMLLAAGVSMKTMSALLGHTTIGVTIDLYSHLQPDARRDALDRLDEFLDAS
jgi:integrase